MCSCSCIAISGIMLWFIDSRWWTRSRSRSRSRYWSSEMVLISFLFFFFNASQLKLMVFCTKNDIVFFFFCKCFSSHTSNGFVFAFVWKFNNSSSVWIWLSFIYLFIFHKHFRLMFIFCRFFFNSQIKKKTLVGFRVTFDVLPFKLFNGFWSYYTTSGKYVINNGTAVLSCDEHGTVSQPTLSFQIILYIH